jgi:gamma-glutamyltranspeptidase
MFEHRRDQRRHPALAFLIHRHEACEQRLPAVPVADLLALLERMARPDQVKDAEASDKLKRRGHRFVLRKPFGNAQAIAYEKNGGTFVGVSDPRGDGSARGT